MSRRRRKSDRGFTEISPIRTRRLSVREAASKKLHNEDEDSAEELKEPSKKRKRIQSTADDEIKNISCIARPVTRSFSLDVEVRPRDVLLSKRILQNKDSPTKGKKDKRQSPKKIANSRNKALRRSHRESRKFFESLNENTLVRGLVVDYLHPEQTSETCKKDGEHVDDGETDSQPENSSHYVTMYDRIKSKSSKEADEGDEGDEEKEEETGSDDDEDDDDDDDDDDAPQQRYKLRKKKPVTKRYTAPPPKSYHGSRRGLFSQHHMRERSCGDKQPFSPVRKTYKLKRKTINESSTSSDEDDDDRKFERRKAKSMAKARNRCLPMNLSAQDLNKGILGDRERIGSSLADVDPMNIDRSITFESIGGLGKHVRSLKEMVVFPLLYPEVFEKFKVNPPRGVLFHGPPGTGKTLMARALANECSQDGKRVAFFMRKGADCLSKWVGESERQLRLLFDQAFKLRPSIIFFDEIDGLAPVRSSRQDQIHSSIVSTLLALMDGLDNRGEIVIIGATNRIDSIDPALRRPGRFDREFRFPLPDKQARRNILTIHTKAWQPRLTPAFINEVADQCVGYCGADIKALCTEAALFALRRRYPQIYASKKKLVLDVESVRVSGKDFAKAVKAMVPACQRAVVSPGRALSSSVRPLLRQMLRTSWNMITRVFPPAVTKTVGESTPGSSVTNFALSDSESSDDPGDEADIYEVDPSSTDGARVARAARAARRAGIKSPNENGNQFGYFEENIMTSRIVHRPRFLVCGKRGMGQSTHISPALLHSMEHIPVHSLDLPVLFGCLSKTAEEACAQVFREARRVAPSIVYLPHIDSLWSATTDTLKATFLSIVRDLPSGLPLMLFATCDTPITAIPPSLASLFAVHHEQVFEVPYPTDEERYAYFEQLFLDEALKLPCITNTRKSREPLEVLPVAPPPEPRQLSVTELQKVREDEENTLRELRIFLREITVKLMSDRRFKEFYKPVDLDEVPDYLDVIENPMDLTTMLQKIDGHHYQTCAEYLTDINLITSNALEYNPNADNLDRLIRHRACALKDTAHSLINSQLDVDFEKTCEDIALSRHRRGDAKNVCAPKFLPVAPVKEAKLPSQTTLSSSLPEKTKIVPRDYEAEVREENLQGTLTTCSPEISRENTQDEDGEVLKEQSTVKTPKKSVKRDGYSRRRRGRFTRKSRSNSTAVQHNNTPNETNGIAVDTQEALDCSLSGKHASSVGNIDIREPHLDGRHDINGKYFEMNSVKTLSSMEEENSVKIADRNGNPDAHTNRYINSLRMRSDVKTALKSHLENMDQVSSRLSPPSAEKERDHWSEANGSVGTSEISNCDSKDVAELDSMLSSSSHVNGLGSNESSDEVLVVNGLHDLPDDDDVSNSVDGRHTEKRKLDFDMSLDDVTPNNDATQVSSTQASSVEEYKDMNSVEKSKRVLFSDEGDISTDKEVSTSVKDKERFRQLLREYVEATIKISVEELELWHSQIRQTILLHKKDPSRLQLLQNLKSLLVKLRTSSSRG